jgi:ABC-type cobalamin transport system ATPase subunit
MLDGVLSEVAAHVRTVVMTSHDLTRSAALASRVDILSKGKIVASVSRGEVEPAELHELYRSVTNG